MPINYSRYPKNWKTEIVPAIRARSGNRCEWPGCGLKNRETVYSIRSQGLTVWYRKFNFNTIPKDHRPKEVKVILTVAHLDHDEENPNPPLDRLMHMCQLHHLRYDTLEKMRRRKLR